MVKFIKEIFIALFAVVLLVIQLSFFYGIWAVNTVYLSDAEASRLAAPELLNEFEDEPEEIFGETEETSLSEEIPSPTPKPTTSPTPIPTLTPEPSPTITPTPAPDGVVHIALFGIDTYNKKFKGRSDAMMIISLNFDEHKICLTSFMRDTLTTVPGHGKGKMNRGYILGGPKLALDTIEYNFGIKVEMYVISNFLGLAAIVDAVGGVEVDVREREVKTLNSILKYMDSKLPGRKRTKPVKKAGLQTLNGRQAVAYARNRTQGGDGTRTKRQRNVLSGIYNNVREVEFLEAVKLLNSFVNHVRTNIDAAKLAELVAMAWELRDCEIEMLRIPTKYKAVYYGKAWVANTNLKQQSKLIHDFIYGEKEE